MGWTIDVPDVPPSLNKVLRMHWATKRAMREGWSLHLLRFIGNGRKELQDATSRRQRVKMLITLHNARQYDRDNAFGACKVIVDAAKAHGLFFDDRPMFLDLEVKQEKCKRKDRHTVIELELA